MVTLPQSDFTYFSLGVSTLGPSSERAITLFLLTESGENLQTEIPEDIEIENP